MTGCKIRHVGKEKFRISFTATHQGLHHKRVQVKGVDVVCNPSTIRVLLFPETNPQEVKMIDFSSPRGIGIAPDGLLLLIQSKNYVIVAINEEGVVSKRIRYQGGSYPKGICITPDNNIVAVSEHSPHIAMYTLSCTLVSRSGNGHGNGPLQFIRPQDVAASTSGHVYVCDTGNHRIQVLNSDLTFYYKFGKKGSRPGQFLYPCGIAIDSQDTIYVCDRCNKRIQKLSSDGTYISEFKLQSEPDKIAIDYNDFVYIDEISLYEVVMAIILAALPW